MKHPELLLTAGVLITFAYLTWHYWKQLVNAKIEILELQQQIDIARGSAKIANDRADRLFNQLDLIRQIVNRITNSRNSIQQLRDRFTNLTPQQQEEVIKELNGKFSPGMV